MDMDYKKLVFVFGASFLVVGILIALVYQQKNSSSTEEQVMAPVVTPQKTDFGNKAPDDFPTDIPLEEGVSVEQSYSLNYVGQKQLTIVFVSTKTVEENYALYAGFLKKQNWIVSNKYESAQISSLYATKENNEINVTINEKISSPTKSQVSISVLKKQ